jgi:hypothetical protein
MVMDKSIEILWPQSRSHGMLHDVCRGCNWVDDLQKGEKRRLMLGNQQRIAPKMHGNPKNDVNESLWQSSTGKVRSRQRQGMMSWRRGPPLQTGYYLP